jgi:hypothetical protein
LQVRDLNASYQLIHSVEHWRCAEDFGADSLYYPYFLGNVAHYFRAAAAPDAIIVAKSGVGFNSLYLGQHGGPTEAETTIPVMVHGARFTGSAVVPPIWELLRFLRGED